MISFDAQPGDVVFVAPGWVHWVLNLCPCFKVAYDALLPQHWPHYIAVWRHITPLFGDANPNDYMAPLVVALNQLLATKL